MTVYDRSVPPGGEGRITLRFNTRGYKGRVRKSAKVYSNDPASPQAVLVIEATVRTPVEISERIVFLRGTAQQAVAKSIEIRGTLDQPLELEPVEYTLDKKVGLRIEEISKGRHFRITFTSIPNAGNDYRGFLKLRTSYPETPEVVIHIRGKFITEGQP